jgi:GTPase SAR1 family protein
MKTDVSNEQLFIAEVDAFNVSMSDVAPALLAMGNWRLNCEAELRAMALSWHGLSSHHPLAQQADIVNQAATVGIDVWNQRWQSSAPAHGLASSLDEQVVLLVFGKFNSGKSSFCNMLAERFSTSGKTVEHFYLDAGGIVATPDAFKEGATETTSRVQGVRLAGKLVLVDTPGLHSVAPDNAALTQLFTDSADAVLWLTSSTSPGQVQELDELGRELQRNKPLLPVLTRSDVYEEDEVDGEIGKVLRGKSPANRTLQEADVSARAGQKLAAMGVPGSLLRPPVSISSLLARQYRDSTAALAESGLEQLYAAMLAMVQPTLAYKRRKHAEILLHHLEENVLGAMRSELMPRIGCLRNAAAALLDALEQLKEAMAVAIWRAVVPQLPALVDRYVTAPDWDAVSTSVSAAVGAAYNKQIEEDWRQYQLAPVGDISASLAADAPTSSDYQGVYLALTAAVNAQAMMLAGITVAQARASIVSLDEQAQQLEAAIGNSGAALMAIKSALRGQCA